MQRDGYKILDCETKVQEQDYLRIHADAIKLCRELGATLDLATSDVVIYVEAKSEEDARKIAACYPDAQFQPENTNTWCIF